MLRTQLWLRIVAISLAILLLSPSVSLAAGRITFFNVGYGDAIWIHDDSGFDALIDSGYAGYADGILAQLAEVPDLDVLMWTHPHDDHIGGLERIVQAKSVGVVLSNGFSEDSATYRSLIKQIDREGVPRVAVKAGDCMQWGGFDVTVLHPDRQYSRVNDASVVLRLKYGDKGFLLMGDAERQAEATLIESGADLRADLLKVGRHGHSASTCSAFLDVVQPRVAVISCPAGGSCPADSTLRRLSRYDIDVRRTDLEGQITLVTDGFSLHVDPLRHACHIPVVEAQSVVSQIP